MPATPLSGFELGAGRVSVGPDGVRATHPDRPDHAYLTGPGGPPTTTHDGAAATFALLRDGADLDEVELVYGLGGLPGLRLVVRHSFGATWLQRYTLDNTGDDAVLLDRLRVEIGAAGPVWALAAGAEAFWTAQPADGLGPVLAAVLQHGEVTGFADDGRSAAWTTGPVRLAPGVRYVVQWQLDWHPTAAAFERRRPSVLPARTELPLGEPCEISGADAAVVVDRGVHQFSDVAADQGPEPGLEPTAHAGTTVLEPERPGRFGVELRSSRGTVGFGVTWFRTVPEWTARAGETWLAGPRTSAGVVRLPGAAAGLVLQAGAHLLADPAGDVPEALDRLAAELIDPARPAPDVLGLALLAGEALRTGDPDQAAAARDGVLARSAPEPGLGLAATRVGLAELAAGRGVGALIGHLADLARAPATSEPVSALAARLELTLISRPHGSRVDDDLLAVIRELATAVGSGLPGAPARPWRSDRLAYVAAVLAMVPEQGAGELTRWCLRGPQALADLLRRRALAELTARDELDESAAQTLAWLVLGQPPV